MPHHHWAIARDGADPAPPGASYGAPEPFADRPWNLYFLAVSPAAHRRGVGSVLVDHVVSTLTDAYRRARNFYLARSFVEEARIREYYGPGDDKVVFWRRIPSVLSRR